MVAAILWHMRERPQESLGVVALNIVQKELIEKLFEKAAAADPVAARYLEIGQQGLEPFFIEILENVQGDERDVIFISVAYGPAAADAPVLQRFRPIAGPSGHRRLNVLFTRAKRRVVIFASMTADDLRVDKKPARHPGAPRLLGSCQGGWAAGGTEHPDGTRTELRF